MSEPAFIDYFIGIEEREPKKESLKIYQPLDGVV